MSHFERLRTAAVTARALVVVLLATGLVLGGLGVSYSADIPIATVSVGQGPSAVAVNTVSNNVYVTNYQNDSVSVIDGVSHSVVASVSMPPTYSAGFPIAVVTDPTRGLAYVANFWEGTVVSIAEPSFNVTATMSDPQPHGGYPRALALDPASSPPKLYVANYGLDTVTVLNALTMARIAEIPTGDTPRAMAIFTSAGRRRVFVGNRYSNDITIIDGDTDSVVGTVALDGPPKAIAVNSTGGKAYVTVPSTDKVVVIGTADTVVATIAVGNEPIGLDFRSAQYGMVACYSGNEVDVIDTISDTVVATAPVGPGPYNVTAAPLDQKWYVTDRLGSTVNVVSSAYAVTTVTVGGIPHQVAVNELLAPREAYCSNFASATVTVIDEPLLVGAAGPFALAPAMAADAPGQRLTVTVDPIAGDTTSSVTPVFAGSVTGTTSPFEFAIAAVWYRLDSEADWRPAEIVEGAGTASVRWRAACGPLSFGAHSIRVMAMDEGMLSASSAAEDGGASGQSSDVSGAYAFTVGYPETWLEQSAPGLVWAGTWSTLARTQFYGGTAAYASGAGKSVTVPFDGTSIDWIGAKTSSGGKADVYLDGLWMGTVDQYSALNRFRQTLFVSGDLAPGAHSLQVRGTGLRNPRSIGYNTWVDAFRVTGTLGP